ncbi:hypothetical protein [Dorea formicigenerans]|uniref:hypothetical protein n=1 Tax=Dorea formicigenerans TaxID=39486 RepID=UPI001D00E997|nr:hypothetical protein [Dorea formicigenerans]MCB5502416.1 hypothetical protein [Dorea formicigenerans]
MKKRKLIRPFTINLEEESKPEEYVKPFAVNLDEKGKSEEYVKPFTVNLDEKGKSEEYVKPFEITNVESSEGNPYAENRELESKKTEASKDDEKKQMISPISYIPTEICDWARKLLGENSPFEPKLAKAACEFVNSGGDLSKVQFVDRKQENQKSEKFSGFNFRLSLKRRVITIFDTANGEIQEFSYGVQVQVTMKNGTKKICDELVDHDKIKSIQWLTKATNSLAYIPKGKEEKIAYEAMVQECIEQEVEEERIYPNAGWRKIPRIGWRYVYKNGIIGGTENVHTKGKNYDLDVRAKYVGTRAMFDKVICMKDICKNGRTSLELLLFVHAGVLTTLFELAGHQLDFSLMVVAPTNSRKTSMVTAMGKIFDRTELKADAEFATATNAGIEKVLGTYKDAPVIIDDFKPGANLTEQREMDRKFDEVLRFFGDRVSKKRMTDFVPNADKIYFPVGGNCIITGEYPPNAIESSLTRLFLTEITSEDVRNDVLAIYQKEKWILSTHIYDFLTWVTERFDICVDIIQQVYISSRSKYTFRVGRFAGMYSTMMCVAKILCLYAEQRAFWSGEESQEFCENVERAVTLELNIMEDRLKRRDKATKVLDIFKTEIETGQIVAVRLNEETCKDRELLYEDDNFYYISTMYLRQIVERRSKDIPDMPPVINSEEMILLLDRKGAIAVLEKDGKRIKSRKLPIQRGNAKRYLYIKKNILNNLEEL